MRVILIHGFNASPEQNFHPWLTRELRDRGIEVLAPALPLKSDSELEVRELVELLKQAIGKVTSKDIFLGHSLGALLLLQYLQAVEMTETPRGVVLVAAPWKVNNPNLRRLFMADLDGEVVMWKAREFLVVHSKEDTLVPIEHGRLLAQSLKARLLETEGDQHYMGAEYPVLLSELERLATAPFEYAPGQTLPDDYATLTPVQRVMDAHESDTSWQT